MPNKITKNFVLPLLYKSFDQIGYMRKSIRAKIN